MNNPKYYPFIVFLLLLLGGKNSRAQVDTSFARTKISLSQYLDLVGKQNLDYAAQQYNVSVAEAGIESAKIFPDPELSLSAFDNQEAALHLGRGINAGIGTTLELGGKRRARINLAQSELELSKSILQDYFRNLRTEAALAYFNAVLQYHLLKVAQSSYNTMKKLADADSIRFRLGSITDIDARQSRLEAGSLRNDLFQGEADWKSLLAQLNLHAGTTQGDTLLWPTGSFENLHRDFSLGTLIIEAQNNRADVMAAINSKAVASSNLQLVKANRKIDLGISADITFSGESTNEDAPTPAYRSVNAGISIPLKFANGYKGDLKAAQFSIKQSELQSEQVLLQVRMEVTQAYLNYKATEKQVAEFENGLLSEAGTVLTGKIYSYKRGETSLLEVLNAQRTYNEVQRNYYQTLFGYAAALVTLEHSAGIWDIN